MKKNVIILIILFLIPFVMQAALTWVGLSALYVDVNGGSSSWYDCSTNWAPNDFNGYTFSNILSLKIGGECQSWDVSGDVATIGWQMRASNNSDVIYSGTVNLPHNSVVGENDKWQEISSQVEVIDAQQLSASTTYKLNVWFYVTDNDSKATTIYDNNSGSNYVATIVTDATLPVELSTFTAQYLAGKPLLYWDYSIRD